MKYLLINGKREKYYNVDNIECMNLTGFPTVKKRGRSKNPVTYYNIANAFDIETTNVKSDKPYAFMYHWQLCFNNDVVIFGEVDDVATTRRELDSLLETKYKSNGFLVTAVNEYLNGMSVDNIQIVHA